MKSVCLRKRDVKATTDFETASTTSPHQRVGNSPLKLACVLSNQEWGFTIVYKLKHRETEGCGGRKTNPTKPSRRRPTSNSGSIRSSSARLVYTGLPSSTFPPERREGRVQCAQNSNERRRKRTHPVVTRCVSRQPRVRRN
jgi:hypothetical protein